MAPGADIQPARALADAAPTGLERVTTRYSVAQDRICLAGELPGGSPVVLWLTQRLLRRLLPPLLAWLQEQGGAAHAVMGSALYADALQGFAQQAARAQLQPQAPVQVGDLRLRPDSLQVTVAGKNIEISAVELRLLETLVETPGAVAGRDHLYRTVLGHASHPFDRRLGPDDRLQHHLHRRPRPLRAWLRGEVRL